MRARDGLDPEKGPRRERQQSQLRFDKAAAESPDRARRGPSWKKTAARMSEDPARNVAPDDLGGSVLDAPAANAPEESYQAPGPEPSNGGAHTREPSVKMDAPASGLRFERKSVGPQEEGWHRPSWKKAAARVRQQEMGLSDAAQSSNDPVAPESDSDNTADTEQYTAALSPEAPFYGDTVPPPTLGQSVPKLRQESQRAGAVFDHAVSEGKLRQEHTEPEPMPDPKRNSQWKRQAGKAVRRETDNQPSSKLRQQSENAGQHGTHSKFRMESQQARPADRLHRDGDSPAPDGPEPSKLRRDKGRMERRGGKLDRAQDRLSKQKPIKRGPVKRIAYHAGVQAHSYVHGKIYETEYENVGTEAAHRAELTGETVVRKTYRVVRNRIRTRPARKVRQAQRRYSKAAAKFQTEKAALKTPEFTPGNVISKTWHRRQQRKRYSRQAREAARQSARQGARATERAAGTVKRIIIRVAELVKDHPAAAVIALLCVLFMLVMQSCMTSLTAIGDGLSGTVAATTYPATDADLLAAEAAYAGLEADLQSKLDSYEDDHDYDEYHFDLDEISHDPYVLMSILSALHPEGWTLADAEVELQALFDRQYILTEDVTTETRYRTETGTDEEGNETETEIPYTYTICTVTLENFNLSHVPVYIMGEEQLSRYALYMASLGNRPDLFASSSYVGLYINGSYTAYPIPPEAMSDAKFAAMITEANKYLGYPYVWGGSSPSTSFDCSGFVSWVINNCGLGWNVGRLGADSLYYICTPVSPANAKPGDLIFFQGTYATDGMSHVGIYVGDGMMIHCGDPVQYTSINTSYWQAHFAAFGRLS